MTVDEPRRAISGWAHSVNAAGHRQTMEDHVESTNRLASGFALRFGGSEFVSAAVELHDRGKWDPLWQDYLTASEESRLQNRAKPRSPIDHRMAGAQAAAARHNIPLALVVLGHHIGLPSRVLGDPTWAAFQRYSRDPEGIARLASAAPPIRGNLAPSIIPMHAMSGAHSLDLFLRFALACLVDADHLDTSRHSQDRSEPYRGAEFRAKEWLGALEAYRARLKTDTTLGRMRETIYGLAASGAEGPTGIYRLEAPTGTGKTLAGLAFALRHAVQREKRRIITALPYTSIVEQTTDTYRRALSLEADPDGAILEHHSALDSSRSDVPESTRGDRATENWDSPIVVTTTVQLFESLFSHRPTKLKKIHNIAGSVVILDEVQAIPAEFHNPIADVLQTLSRHYDTTFLLMTATQPALEGSRGRFRGLDSKTVHDLVPNPREIFSSSKRVRFEFGGPPWSWTRVAEEMSRVRQCMVVVNTRRHAVELYDALGDDKAFHLSTYLCGAHRRSVLARVREALSSGEACRLVSTQIVEAGVDLDFPLVLRAMGPLDRIVQAAGRCNREGKEEAGRVVVFDPEDAQLPAGPYATATEETRLLLREKVDLDDPATFARYFEAVSRSVNPDRWDIQGLRERLDFPAVARHFHFIEETLPVAVPYTDDVTRLLRAAVDSASARRALQPYVVTLRPREIEDVTSRGLAFEEVEGLWRWLGEYDRKSLGIARHTHESMMIG